MLDKKLMEQFKQYLQDKKHASANTILSYERDVNQFERYLEERGWKISKESVLDYISFLKTPL